MCREHPKIIIKRWIKNSLIYYKSVGQYEKQTLIKWHDRLVLPVQPDEMSRASCYGISVYGKMFALDEISSYLFFKSLCSCFICFICFWSFNPISESCVLVKPATLERVKYELMRLCFLEDVSFLMTFFGLRDCLTRVGNMPFRWPRALGLFSKGSVVTPAGHIPLLKVNWSAINCSMYITQSSLGSLGHSPQPDYRWLSIGIIGETASWDSGACIS